jgi:hypothetical protein
MSSISSFDVSTETGTSSGVGSAAKGWLCAAGVDVFEELVVGRLWSFPGERDLELAENGPKSFDRFNV